MSDQQPVFNIEKIYVRDLSLEVPNAPQIFMSNDAPKLDVQLTQGVQSVDGALFEVTLNITITAKAGDKTVFLVEVAQAGIFQIRNVPQAELDPILGVVCPNVLFPYAREAVSDTVSRAGFPPLLLSPVNFEALYQQRMAEQQSPKIEIAH